MLPAAQRALISTSWLSISFPWRISQVSNPPNGFSRPCRDPSCAHARARAWTAAIRRPSARAERENNVHTHGHRKSGRRPAQRDWLTPEQHAAAFAQALTWRQRWRDEMVARNREEDAEKIQTVKRPRQTNGLDRAKFAAAVARAEFGRFYWDGRKDRLSANGRKRSDKKRRNE
jgi:hypothetical protein